jgi:hypothetical protein
MEKPTYVPSQILEHIQFKGELEEQCCEVKVKKHGGSIVVADIENKLK